MHKLPAILLLLGSSVWIGCSPQETAVSAQTPVEASQNQSEQEEVVSVASVQTDDSSWPLFRGDAQSTGVAKSKLPDDLTLLWKFVVKDGAFEGTPVIHDGVAYIGDLDGAVFALNLENGEKKWEHETEAGFIASPAIHEGSLYIGDYDGTFYCLDAESGKPRWKFVTDAEIDACANFYKGNVLIGSQDATLYCVNTKNGELVWKHMIDDQIRCSPTIVDDRVFLAGCDGKLHIVGLDKGEELASVEIGAPTGVTPAVQGSYVYFGTEGGEFLCVNWKEAVRVWTFTGKGGTQPYRSSAAATEKHVVVGSRAKRVHSFDPSSGEEQWTFAAKHRIDSSPVVVGDRVYIGSSDGRIYGLDLASGDKQWEYEAKGGFTGSPAVAEGKLVIASDEGVVYCFGAREG